LPIAEELGGAVEGLEGELACGGLVEARVEAGLGEGVDEEGDEGGPRAAKCGDGVELRFVDGQGQAYALEDIGDRLEGIGGHIGAVGVGGGHLAYEASGVGHDAYDGGWELLADSVDGDAGEDGDDGVVGPEGGGEAFEGVGEVLRLEGEDDNICICKDLRVVVGGGDGVVVGELLTALGQEIGADDVFGGGEVVLKYASE